MHRNAFYRDGYRKMQKITLISVTGLVISMIIAAVAIMREPESKYFPTGPGCTLQAMTPLDQPVVSDAEVYDYATRTAMRFFAFDFVNYQQLWSQVKPLFTEIGWKGWMEALDRAGTMEVVRRSRAVVSSVVRGAPVMVEQGPQAGIYVWKVQFPLLVTYAAASEQRSQPMIIEVTVIRRPVVEDPLGKGLAVHRFLARPASS